MPAKPLDPKGAGTPNDLPPPRYQQGYKLLATFWLLFYLARKLGNLFPKILDFLPTDPAISG